MAKRLSELDGSSSQKRRVWLFDTPDFVGYENLAREALGGIASWSNVELAQLHVWTAVLGGRETLSAAIFSALKGTKLLAVNVAVDARFGSKSDESRVYSALMGYSQSLEGERNKLAHWVWGYRNEDPDHLLLVNPKDITLRGVHHADAAFAYSSADFQELTAKNVRLREMWSYFALLVHIHQQTPKRASLLQRLLDAPELQNGLSRHRHEHKAFE